MTPTYVLRHFSDAFVQQFDVEDLPCQCSEAKSCTPITLWALFLFCIAMIYVTTFQLIFSFVHPYGGFELFLCIEHACMQLSRRACMHAALACLHACMHRERRACMHAACAASMHACSASLSCAASMHACSLRGEHACMQR